MVGRNPWQRRSLTCRNLGVNNESLCFIPLSSWAQPKGGRKCNEDEGADSWAPGRRRTSNPCRRRGWSLGRALSDAEQLQRAIHYHLEQCRRGVVRVGGRPAWWPTPQARDAQHRLEAKAMFLRSMGGPPLRESASSATLTWRAASLGRVVIRLPWASWGAKGGRR